MSVLPTPEPPGPNPGQPGHFAHTDWLTASVKALDSDAVPVGAVLLWSAGSPPGGWLICDGSTFSSTLYPRLAALLGDTFGVHSGDNYYLPNYVDRFPVGASAAKPPASAGGSATIALTQVPAHTHTGPSHTHSTPAHKHNQIQTDGGANLSWKGDAFTSGAAPGIFTSGEQGLQTSTDGAGTTGASGTAATGSAGGGQPYHPPYLALHFVIRAG